MVIREFSGYQASSIHATVTRGDKWGRGRIHFIDFALISWD